VVFAAADHHRQYCLRRDARRTDAADHGAFDSIRGANNWVPRVGHRDRSHRVDMASLNLAGVNLIASLADFSPIFAHSRLWYYVPLLVSISLVYGATRDERMLQILDHSLRFCVWVLTFMLTIAVIVILFTWLV